MRQHKRKIYRICDDEWVGLSLLRHDELHLYNIVGDGSNATLEELEQLCVSEAENDNHHKFCRIVPKLRKLLVRHAGEEAAKKILREIAESGGLHCLHQD